MPSFAYMARDRSGMLQTGHLDAVGEDEVVAILQNRGLVVTSLTRRDAAGQQKSRTLRRKARRMSSRVRSQDKVQFCQQLSTLLDAGIPLVKSLEVIGGQVDSQPLMLAVEQMRQDIEGGRTFRDAMAKHPKIFSSFWINLVETGEASGHLAQSLHQLGAYVESAQELQSKAATAMTYPAVLIGACVIAVAIFVLKIIPIFAGIFASMGMKLPFLTQLLINTSNFARKYIVLIAGGTVAGFFGLRQLAETDEARWLIDRVLLKLPVFSTLFTGLQLAQFARGLSTLLESGVPILYSLEIVASSASNRVFARSILEIKDYVREGKTMAEPLMNNAIFPPMLVQMVQVGEEIGELGKMLDRVARYYEAQVKTFIDRMSVLFEPLAIMMMGLVIGTLVLAMFMPIFSMASSFKVQQ